MNLVLLNFFLLILQSLNSITFSISSEASHFNCNHHHHRPSKKNSLFSETRSSLEFPNALSLPSFCSKKSGSLPGTASVVNFSSNNSIPFDIDLFISLQVSFPVRVSNGLLLLTAFASSSRSMICLPVKFQFQLSLVAPASVFFQIEIQSLGYLFLEKQEIRDRKKVADIFKDGKWHSIQVLVQSTCSDFYQVLLVDGEMVLISENSLKVQMSVCQNLDWNISVLSSSPDVLISQKYTGRPGNVNQSLILIPNDNQSRYESLQKHWLFACIFYGMFVALPATGYFHWIIRLYQDECQGDEEGSDIRSLRRFSGEQHK